MLDGTLTSPQRPDGSTAARDPRTATLRPACRLAGVEGVLDLLDASRTVTERPSVDLLTHGLQCAALLERDVPDDLELQVAGLIHDIGTLLEPDRPASHPAAGAAALRPLFGERVAGLVAGHDEAKRYLLTVDAQYRHRLHPRSLATLREQGGLFDPEERAAFVAHPDADALIALRRADDAAWHPGLLVPGLEHWTLALYAVAARVA